MPHPPTAGELSAVEIMRLIADDAATETDHNATEDLLEAFAESLDARE
jgi:hypothetical protein